MSIYFSHNVIHYAIGIINPCGKNDSNIKIELKKETKYRWETIDVIPLLPLVGVSCCQPIINFSKRMVHIH